MLDDDDLTDDQSEDDEDDEDDDADGYEEAEEEFGFMGDEGDELEEDDAVIPFDSFGDGDEELPEDEDAFLDGEGSTTVFGSVVVVVGIAFLHAWIWMGGRAKPCTSGKDA